MTGLMMSSIVPEVVRLSHSRQDLRLAAYQPIATHKEVFIAALSMIITLLDMALDHLIIA